MKVTGIWIDRKEAQLMHYDGENQKIVHLDSGIEDYNPRGGARSRQAWGPQDKMDERKLNKRKHHQEQAFCKEIFRHIRDRSHVYIFGPAQMKDVLSKFITGESPPKPQIVGVDTAGYLTENQKMAQVRSVFSEIITK